MGFFTEDGFTTGRLGGWVNIPMMKAAIAKAGYSAVRVPDRWPPGGALPAVVMIQWIGPWMNPGVPAAARCQHRHWVAYQAGWIWDVNTDKWQRFEDWLAEIVPQLLPKKATAWTVALSLILTKKA